MPEPQANDVDPRWALVGKIVHRVGVWTFPACLGAVFGFYMADRGTLWLPSMLALLLVVGAVALGMIAGGRALQGEAFRKTSKGRVIRRRVLAAMTLAFVAGIARLALFWVEQPSPLTALSRDEFDQTYIEDAKQYTELDSGLEHYLILLEARPRALRR